ncbi:uncharacterized protein LOC123268337 [Cotesia glomerata]|uniref:uncharacterized protein LOC123268337 n=1 Tax=Cotesia glomerata TaxID=32391 RepID=UPI001D00AEC4|nr:uncharacterized protein LOC123268337 [Cotesia glomerata]
MSDHDNLESESDQPPAKKAKSHYDTLSSHQTQQSSQGSQNIIIETGHHQDQLNTRHTINVISQGGTYDEVVYEYSKSHSISLLYVALTRVTSLEGLFICNSQDNLRFYHGRRVDPSVSSLQQEFKRLSLNKFTTLQGLITEFINSRNKLTIYTLNCQSLRKHATDLQDSICQRSNFLLLTETWLPADESVDLPNFHCIAKFKRQNGRATGVAIYKNNNTSHITTFNMDLVIQNATEVHVSQTSIGDICTSHVKLEDGSELMMIVVYISPNKKINDIISFLHERLFPYSHRGSITFKTNKDKLPLILAGDFNVNFAKDESTPLITFLQEEFQLQINNNPREPTTRYGTTIDAVFIRYLDNVMSNTFVTYFSYHRPIVTVIPSSEATSNITITEVTD